MYGVSSCHKKNSYTDTHLKHLESTYPEFITIAYMDKKVKIRIWDKRKKKHKKDD